jgi:hypothetical protein
LLAEWPTIKIPAVTSCNGQNMVEKNENVLLQSQESFEQSLRETQVLERVFSHSLTRVRIDSSVHGECGQKLQKY